MKKSVIAIIILFSFNIYSVEKIISLGFRQASYGTYLKKKKSYKENVDEKNITSNEFWGAFHYKINDHFILACIS